MKQRLFLYLASFLLLTSTLAAQTKFYPLPRFPLMKGDIKTPGESGIPTAWHSAFELTCQGKDRSIGSITSIARCWIFPDGVVAYSVGYNFNPVATLSDSIDKYLRDERHLATFESSNLTIMVSGEALQMPVRSFADPKFGNVRVVFVRLGKAGTAYAYVVEAKEQEQVDRYFEQLKSSVGEYAQHANDSIK